MSGVCGIPRRALRLAAVGMLLVAALAVGSPPASAASPVSCATYPAGGCLDAAAEEDYLSAPGEHWLEVDLDAHEVILRAGPTVLARVPAATGRNDTARTTTYPGLYRVYAKYRGLSYLPAERVYVRDWVAFDRRWRNGFHSFPMDRRGVVLDGRLGLGITSGCVRTSASDTIYSFARVGMKVLVYHGSENSREIRQRPFRWLRRAL